MYQIKSSIHNRAGADTPAERGIEEMVSPEVVELCIRDSQERIKVLNEWIETEGIKAPCQVRTAIKESIEEQRKSLEFWEKQKETQQAEG